MVEAAEISHNFELVTMVQCLPGAVMWKTKAD